MFATRTLPRRRPVRRLNLQALEDRTVPTILPGPVPTDWAVAAGGHLNLYTGLAWSDETAIDSSQWTWSPANTAANNSTRNGFDDWRLPNLNEALAAARDQSAVSQGFLNTQYWSQVPYWTSTPGDRIQGKTTHWLVHFREPNLDPVNWKDTYSGLLIISRDSANYGDDGDPGFASTGSWSTKTFGNKPKTLSGYLGDARIAAAGDGSSTATWTFAGLEVGAEYKLAVNWLPASGYATNAPFTVLDGTTDLGTVQINQTVAPNDFQVADQNWEGLGVVTTDSGTLSVRLSNQANGTVIADGVRIFKIYPATAPSNPLTAATETSVQTTAPLADAQLQPIVREAIRRWNQLGLTAAERTLLNSAHFNIADLDGATLGLSTGNTVTLDLDAAGNGWFVDPTPRSNSEFVRPGDQDEQGKVDLLTAVMHELGHVLGRKHTETGVMAETLATGTRESFVPGVHVGHGSQMAPAGRPSWFLSSSRKRW